MLRRANYGNKCDIGDVIEIELDLNTFEIKYRVNDEDMGIAYKDIEDTQYRVALSTGDPGAIVEMLH